jgi:hypothetical protein
MTDKEKDNKKPAGDIKKTYIKPQIISEKLNSYGAICNATTTGGRKASSTGPAFCNASRLNS